MKFSWLSNAPWTPSGYGQQTRITVNRLASLGHDVGIICYHGLQGGVIQLGPKITCFPVGGHPYGNDIAVPHTAVYKGQFMASLTDVWVMNPEEYPTGFKWVPWFPVDHDPMPVVIRQKLNNAWKRIAMSKFGVQMANEAGLDCLYAPLMVETGLLFPKDKAEARKNMGLPTDRWIAGIVAMNKGNPSRKNLVEQITAFRACQKRHPDMFLWLQTARGDVGGDLVNIPELCAGLGMMEGADFAFCNQYQNIVGFPPPYFQELYNSLDVLLSVTAGEGFGIPIIEAQACGVPVLVGGWTSMPELCKAGRVFDKSDAYPEYSQFASYRWKPLQRPLELMIEAEYQFPSCATQAPEWIKAEYDADVVVEKYWKPVLANIEAGL
jgi:glycosyltransferase involved in cell wall biosynthesis